MSAIDRLRRRLRRGRAPEPLACNELVELVTDYFEGLLTDSERARFDAHLAGCQGCRTYVEQMRETIEALGRLRTDDIPLRGRDELLHAFRTWRT